MSSAGEPLPRLAARPGAGRPGFRPCPRAAREHRSAGDHERGDRLDELLQRRDSQPAVLEWQLALINRDDDAVVPPQRAVHRHLPRFSTCTFASQSPSASPSASTSASTNAFGLLGEFCDLVGVPRRVPPQGATGSPVDQAISGCAQVGAELVRRAEAGKRAGPARPRQGPRDAADRRGTEPVPSRPRSRKPPGWRPRSGG